MLSITTVLVALVTGCGGDDGDEGEEATAETTETPADNESATTSEAPAGDSGDFCERLDTLADIASAVGANPDLAANPDYQAEYEALKADLIAGPPAEIGDQVADLFLVLDTYIDGEVPTDEDSQASADAVASISVACAAGEI